LKCLGITPSVGKDDIKRFADYLAQAAKTTRYLCWVEAEPGEVVNLQVSYTTDDPLRQLGRGTIIERLATLWRGISEPRNNRREVWADWYRQFGLSPINYEFSIPSHKHAGSYYFSIEPPSHTDVTFLDWEVGNSLEDKEIDSSTRSAHIHNEDDPDGLDPGRGGIIRAYLHCSPQDHKLIMGAALLNCVYVVLIAIGRVPGKIGTPGQTVLLAAPSVFVGYLARQQRHYFADAMRRQRGILWWYLGISITFLVTITFSKHEGSIGSQGLGWFATFVTWVWGVSSAAVVGWYFPLGSSYERIIESIAKRKMLRVRKAEEIEEAESLEGIAIENGSLVVRVLETLPLTRIVIERLRKRRLEIVDSWKCYQRAVREYSSQIARLITFSMIGMLALLASVWHLPPKHKPPIKKAIVSTQITGTFFGTARPAMRCKGCNINLRFVREPSK
jgi:hypothetical protein